MMRYLVLCLTLLLCLFFNGVVFVQYPIFGIQPDLMLCCMVLMTLQERTLTPVFYFAAGGAAFDLLFSTGLGLSLIHISSRLETADSCRKKFF